jgi:DNA mismatch repair protein MutS
MLAQERSMNYASVLFRNEADRVAEDRAAAPDCFRDLNLDQIVAAVIAGKEDYNLAPFFHMPLHDADAVAFRHEVMRDLEDARLYQSIGRFARAMHAMRAHLAELDHRFYERQKERWFLDAVDLYGEAVDLLVRDLADGHIASRGLRRLRDHAARYAASERFLALTTEAKRLKSDLAAIRYSVFIDGPRVEVRPYGGDGDYSAEVDGAFARFQQGTTHEYKFSFSDAPEMNHIEAQILDGVAHLHPEIFPRLAEFRAANADFQDEALVAFDREIQFYVACLEHIARFKEARLEFCYPRVSQGAPEFEAQGAFDLALAGKLIGEGATPVTNDFHLEGAERIIVVSGPNQGGKTTTARTFGQLHYLGSLGCLVPGTSALLSLPDRIFTHFEREERMTNLRGKLQDDLVRMHDILAAVTASSIIIINEIFASTTLRDALYLSRKIGAAVIALDALCLWVTFIDEVASLGPQTVSMVATVVPDNPAQRTFKIVRRPADGLAHAMALAEKHRLTYAMIADRIGP